VPSFVTTGSADGPQFGTGASQTTVESSHFTRSVAQVPKRHTGMVTPSASHLFTSQAASQPAGSPPGGYPSQVQQSEKSRQSASCRHSEITPPVSTDVVLLDVLVTPVVPPSVVVPPLLPLLPLLPLDDPDTDELPLLVPVSVPLALSDPLIVPPLCDPPLCDPPLCDSPLADWLSLDESESVTLKPTMQPPAKSDARATSEMERSDEASERSIVRVCPSPLALRRQPPPRT